jgi:hypothetical protein
LKEGASQSGARDPASPASQFSPLEERLTTLLVDQRVSSLGVSTGEAERHARLAGMALFEDATYFASIVMLPSMSLSDWLGPKLSSRLLVSTRCPLLAPSVIVPTRWV